MVEMGQMCFGNKWEQHEAPRWVAEDLYRLSELLGTRAPEAQVHGFLGGPWGYGQEFSNAVFEMHPYYWGDCECGFEEREDAWHDAHKHSAECYQTALDVLRAEKRKACGYDKPGPLFTQVYSGDAGLGVTVEVFVPSKRSVNRSDIDKATERYDMAMRALCEARGLTYPDSCERHCTCSHDAEYESWITTNDHASTCRSVLPNFRHKRSGLAVHWYKYIGRSMTMSAAVEQAEWRAIFADCLASLGVSVA